eukprot:6384398-Prymnesium_polylepis.1
MQRHPIVRAHFRRQLQSTNATNTNATNCSGVNGSANTSANARANTSANADCPLAVDQPSSIALQAVVFLSFPTNSSWSFLNVDKLGEVASAFASYFSVDAPDVAVKKDLTSVGAILDLQ